MKKYLAWILICSMLLGVLAACNNGTPTGAPSEVPTDNPTEPLTDEPTEPPTQAPTEAPTQAPTETPTQMPTEAPTQAPTEAPTQTPTEAPTQAPTEAPTQAPSEAPSSEPTEAPTGTPTETPTQTPTEAPTQAPTEAPTQAPTEAPTEPTIELTDYYVNLNSSSVVSSNLTGAHSLSVSYAGGAASMNFVAAGHGYVDDPYVSLKLPSTQINCQEYPYIAILVKTSEPILEGELRFQTTVTGTSVYPCQPFTHQYDDGWQLIVSKLTDLSTEKYYGFTAPFIGNYTMVRLDLFHPSSTGSGLILPETEYYIKAYAFFKKAGDASELLKLKPDDNSSNQETPNVKYEDFWLGKQFEKPTNDKRMNWVHYGFGQSTAPVDLFLKEGYGGIVSNVNFNQNYLTNPKEFAILKNIYDYAADSDMTLWIYDEYQWPSGKAFGLVLDHQPGREWESTGIQHVVLTGEGGTASYKLGDTNGASIDIGIMQAVLTDSTGSKNLNVSNGSISATASGSWKLDIYLLRYTYEGGEDRTDFTTLRHVDLLNPDAVKCFIDVTHEQYKEYLGESFKNITAFFTDEPQLGNRAKEDYVVWTAGFAERFYETYGYEINIPSLFSGNTTYDRTIRLNYYQLVATMFKESYIDQISDWCESNGVASSGHLLFEEDMNDHIETYGGNFMQVVGGMTIPGADVLWVDPDHLLSPTMLVADGPQVDPNHLLIRNYIGNYMGLRYVSSAAKNAGKNDVMIEFNPNAVSALDIYEDDFGVTIGGLSITRLLGTNIYNVINPTRDYTSLELNGLNTYIGRLNTILDETTECGELGVFYPIATVQAYHDADSVHSSEHGKGDTEAMEINAGYETVCLGLLQNQLMFTVLDDESIRQATITPDGKMVIGLGSYSTIVLPYTEYISVEALEKLVEFGNAGGKVILFKSKISHGLKLEQEDEIEDIMSSLKNSTVYSLGLLLTEIKKTVSTSLTTEVSVGNRKDFLMGDFASETHEVSFLVNTGDTDMTVQWSYTDGYTGTATVYYPGSGDIKTIDCSNGTSEIVIPAYHGVLVVRES